MLSLDQGEAKVVKPDGGRLSSRRASEGIFHGSFLTKCPRNPGGPKYPPPGNLPSVLARMSFAEWFRSPDCHRERRGNIAFYLRIQRDLRERHLCYIRSSVISTNSTSA